MQIVINHILALHMNRLTLRMVLNFNLTRLYNFSMSKLHWSSLILLARQHTHMNLICYVHLKLYQLHPATFFTPMLLILFRTLSASPHRSELFPLDVSRYLFRHLLNTMNFACLRRAPQIGHSVSTCMLVRKASASSNKPARSYISTTQP